MAERLARYETIVHAANRHSGFGGGGIAVSVFAASNAEAVDRAIAIGWSGNPRDARVLVRSVSDVPPAPAAVEEKP